MRYKILIPVFLFTLQVFCQKREITDKDLSQGILYELPNKVHNSLNSKLNYKKNKNIYLQLSQENSFLYRIYIQERTMNENIFLQKTNRYVIISDVVYPLVLSLDYTFGVKQSPKEILKQIKKNGEYMTTNLGINNDSQDYIEFDIRER